MIVLIINTGSSSLKYQLIKMHNADNTEITDGGDLIKHDSDHRVMASGVVERIGEVQGRLIHKKISGEETLKFIKEQEIKDHAVSMHLATEMLTDKEAGVIAGIKEIDAIGHRVVQGGEDFNSSILIDDAVKKAIKDNNPLAPLHNPPNLMGIEVAESLFPETPNIAVFDTEFHQSIPQKAFMYALPYDFYENLKVRRYGFHGTSHKYVSRTASLLMNTKMEDLNLITVHLGNGCSICAIEKGRCVDTSMGMTPLAGVMMGTRTGDIDPAIQKYLLEYTHMTPEELDTVFNKKSGLKGICGMNDMRDIHAAISEGDSRAKLALDMFCYQVKKYIGAYFAVLGNVDAIIFTAGIGENDNVIREAICSDLSGLGIDLDRSRNSQGSSEARSVHSAESRVQLWVIPTNEELQIAREVVSVLGR